VRPAGLTRRVAAAAAAGIVVGVVVLGVAVLARLGDQLKGTLDRALRARAVEVARLAASTPELLTQPGTLEGRLGGSQLLVQVVDRRGRIVARSNGLGSRVLPQTDQVRDALTERRAGYGDAGLGPDPVRLYAAPLGELGRGAAAGGAVIVAGTTSELEETLSTTRRFVLISGLAAVLLATVLATAFAWRALAPLRRLSGGARVIERSGDASERLPVPAARDEVGELAETLNAMLASLQRAREAEQRFVGDASHELRTPLTALRGNAAYVARHGPDPEALADIEADAARLSALLDDLLALAREDAGAPLRAETVDLAEIARAAARQDAHAEALGEPALVRGERTALERAVGNLVSNARRHGPPEGRIEIVTRRAGDRALIEVADEGPGIPAGEAAHAFERFWRAPGAGGAGAGLGLPIVRAIAERHGGRVSVAGARFTLDLPALTDLSKLARRTPFVTLSFPKDSSP
jgi:two-component system, OmpR family, sensor kinase